MCHLSCTAAAPTFYIKWEIKREFPICLGRGSIEMHDAPSSDK